MAYFLGLKNQGNVFFKADALSHAISVFSFIDAWVTLPNLKY